jgi:hypothetical protein
MPLREDFEPFLLSPYGLHSSPELCRMAWDREVALATKDLPWPELEARLREEIARADAWLRLCDRTSRVNPRIGSSYGLKHKAENWHRVRHPDGNSYMANGCFLMAADRLGFVLRGVPGNYCFEGGYIRDTHNALLNIRSGSWPKG